MRIFFALALALTLAASAVHAQVPKGAVAEDATATWCQYCPAAYQGLEVMKTRYDNNEFTPTRLYSSSQGGHLATAETDARISWYGVTGYPTVMFNGSTQVVGGGTVVASGAAYDPLVSAEIAKPSPIKITINSATFNDPTATLNVDIEVAETIANIANVKIKAYLLENDVYWCCGYGGEDTWEDVIRDIAPDVNLSVSQVGQVQNVQHTFPIDPTWDNDQLWMVVMVQNYTDKYIWQVENSLPKPAYSMRYWSKGERAAIAPSLGAYQFQDFAVYNLGTNPDVISVNLDTTVLPPGWTCTITDGVNDYTSIDLALNPWESRIFRLKITPHSPGYAKPAVVLTSTNLPGVERRIGYSFVTNDVQVLVVDDDGGESFENYYSDALSNYGATFGILDRNYLSVLSGAQLLEFPVVVWEVGFSFPTVTADDRAAITAFLNGGGKLFINGQDLGWEMNDIGGDAMTWYNNVLHANWILDDTNKYILSGAAGDAISDGMTLTIQGGDGANNQEYPDAIDARDAAASRVFTYNNTSPIRYGAIKVDTGTYRLVYCGFGYEAISNATDRRLLMSRILSWFNLQPVGVEDQDSVLLEAAVQAIPNPALGQTTLRVDLPATGRMQLGIYDLDGSLVRSLRDGAEAAGSHGYLWDGRDDAGHAVPSGTYFYRLTTGNDVQSGKLTFTR